MKMLPILHNYFERGRVWAEFWYNGAKDRGLYPC